MDRLAEQPFAIAFGALFMVVMLRAQLLSARYGVIAVPLSFLTEGVQTAINFGAGFTRMPLSRYLPAVTVGGLMWELRYSTVGMVGWVAIATLWSSFTA